MGRAGPIRADHDRLAVFPRIALRSQRAPPSASTCSTMCCRRVCSRGGMRSSIRRCLRLLVLLVVKGWTVVQVGGKPAHSRDAVYRGSPLFGPVLRRAVAPCSSARASCGDRPGRRQRKRDRLSCSLFFSPLSCCLLLSVSTSASRWCCPLFLGVQFKTERMVDTTMLPLSMINGVDSYALVQIPLFILAGELMNRGGLTAAPDRLVAGDGRARCEAVSVTSRLLRTSSWPACPAPRSRTRSRRASR